MNRNNKSGDEGGDGRHKFVQTLVNAETHKALRLLAIDTEVTLAELLRCIIDDFLRVKELERSSHGRENRRNRTRSGSTKEA